jgi:uncharacterized protein YceK
MMRRIVVSILLLAVSPAMTGCMALKGTFFEEKEKNVIYVGIRESLSCLSTLCPHYGWIPLIIDLPLSFVMDTALLPYSVYKTVRNHEAAGSPILVQLPQHYHGWVVIRYEDLSCPLLDEGNDPRIIVVKSSGRTCTANSAPPLFSTFGFEAVSEDGKTRTTYREYTEGEPPPNPEKDVRVWIRYRARIQDDVIFPKDRFFLGTKEELSRSLKRTPDLRDTPQPTGK